MNLADMLTYTASEFLDDRTVLLDGDEDSLWSDSYLVRQFKWIKEGKRRNANPDMVKQVQNFSEDDIEAVLDYTSRLKPPPEMVAPEGWKNPDFILKKK